MSGGAAEQAEAVETLDHDAVHRDIFGVQVNLTHAKVREWQQWIDEKDNRGHFDQFFVLAKGTLPRPISKKQEGEFKSRLNREYQRAIEGPAEAKRHVKVVTNLKAMGSFKVTMSPNTKFRERGGEGKANRGGLLFGAAFAASGGGEGGGGGRGVRGGRGGEEVDAAMLKMTRAVSNAVSTLLGAVEEEEKGRKGGEDDDDDDENDENEIENDDGERAVVDLGIRLGFAYEDMRGEDLYSKARDASSAASSPSPSTPSLSARASSSFSYLAATGVAGGAAPIHSSSFIIRFRSRPTLVLPEGVSFLGMVKSLSDEVEKQFQGTNVRFLSYLSKDGQDLITEARGSNEEETRRASEAFKTILSVGGGRRQGDVVQGGSASSSFRDPTVGGVAQGEGGGGGGGGEEGAGREGGGGGGGGGGGVGGGGEGREEGGGGGGERVKEVRVDEEGLVSRASNFLLRIIAEMPAQYVPHPVLFQFFMSGARLLVPDNSQRLALYYAAVEELLKGGTCCKAMDMDGDMQAAIELRVTLKAFGRFEQYILTTLRDESCHRTGGSYWADEHDVFGAFRARFMPSGTLKLDLDVTDEWAKDFEGFDLRPAATSDPEVALRSIFSQSVALLERRGMLSIVVVNNNNNNSSSSLSATINRVLLLSKIVSPPMMQRGTSTEILYRHPFDIEVEGEEELDDRRTSFFFVDLIRHDKMRRALDQGLASRLEDLGVTVKVCDKATGQDRGEPRLPIESLLRRTNAKMIILLTGAVEAVALAKNHIAIELGTASSSSLDIGQLPLFVPGDEEGGVGVEPLPHEPPSSMPPTATSSSGEAALLSFDDPFLLERLQNLHEHDQDQDYEGGGNGEEDEEEGDDMLDDVSEYTSESRTTAAEHSQSIIDMVVEMLKTYPQPVGGCDLPACFSQAYQGKKLVVPRGQGSLKNWLSNDKRIVVTYGKDRMKQPYFAPSEGSVVTVARAPPIPSNEPEVVLERVLALLRVPFFAIGGVSGNSLALKYELLHGLPLVIPSGQLLKSWLSQHQDEINIITREDGDDWYCLRMHSPLSASDLMERVVELLLDLGNPVNSVELSNAFLPKFGTPLLLPAGFQTVKDWLSTDARIEVALDRCHCYYSLKDPAAVAATIVAAPPPRAPLHKTRRFYPPKKAKYTTPPITSEEQAEDHQRSLYIFVDNSNVQLLNHLMVGGGGGGESGEWNTPGYTFSMESVYRGRSVAKKVLIGSLHESLGRSRDMVLLKIQEAHAKLSPEGWDLTLLPLPLGIGEEWIDDKIHAKIIDAVTDECMEKQTQSFAAAAGSMPPVKPRPVLVLFSADSNNNSRRSTFPRCLNFVLQLGWNCEVWVPNTHINKYHLGMANKHGSRYKLFLMSSMQQYQRGAWIAMGRGGAGGAAALGGGGGGGSGGEVGETGAAMGGGGGGGGY